MQEKDNTIQISILLAARNEEHNIERCLRSLDALNFPKENIEIIIGDDDSDDDTADIILDYIEGKQQFKYLKITEQLAGLKGKANVLAQLAHHATGKYFFFVDADIAVPTTWLTHMFLHFGENTGVVVGLTRMKKSHLLADFLSMEWLYALSVTRLASFFQVPITGMGNNMAVTREAYFAIGGYEKIGFSIVEDYTLFMSIVRKGYHFEQAYNPQILNISEPVNTFAELMKQRKRWMQGVMQSFWVTKWSLIISSQLVPFLLILAYWYPAVSLMMIGLHYALTTVTALIAITILKQKDLWKAAILFWFYVTGMGGIMLINYVLPRQMEWKGRKY